MSGLFGFGDGIGPFVAAGLAAPPVRLLGVDEGRFFALAAGTARHLVLGNFQLRFVERAERREPIRGGFVQA
jgi:hypothetical protein